MGSNLFLRLAWLFTLVPTSIYPSVVVDSEALVLVLALLELFRRWQWVLLRIEWEHVKSFSSQTSQQLIKIKTQGKTKKKKKIFATDEDSESSPNPLDGTNAQLKPPPRKDSANFKEDGVEEVKRSSIIKVKKVPFSPTSGSESPEPRSSLEGSANE